MYSHGSSARVGVGKQGHGGREYRPPRKRRDPNATPPPLKECACLCQLDVPEYLQTAPTSRSHTSWGGREAVQDLERQLRSLFLVHLVVPGRKQAGPVAVVGQTYQQALPAVAYLLHQLIVRADPTENNVAQTIPGRFQRRVQDPNDIVLEGLWCLPPSTLSTTSDDNAPSPLLQTAWIFQSPPCQWNVMACFLPQSEDSNSVNIVSSVRTQKDPSQVETSSMSMLAMETLQISMENFQFRMGNNMEGMEIFTHDDDPFIALATGHPSQTQALWEEIEKSMASSVMER